MADHKLLSTPVSVSDGFKRGDRRTWFTLLVAGVVAVVIVVLLNLFVEKPAPVRWPTTAPAAPASAPSEEPRAYDVAPPGSHLPPPQSQPESKGQPQ